VILRGLALASSSLFAGLALKAMPMAETKAIICLAPFGVMLLSGPLLNDKVRLSGWIATALRFIGLLLIVRPRSGVSPTGVTFGLLSILGAIVYHRLSRSLAKPEITMALLFYTAIIGTIVFGAILPWTTPALTPQGLDAVLLLALGGMPMVGHLLFTAAYRVAAVSVLTPVNYMRLA
jgi:drug/metabolite transporter (DMT)-like permease